MIYRQKIGAQKLLKRKRIPKRRVIRRVKKTASAFRHSEISLESEESTNLNNGLDSFALDSSLRALHYAQNDWWEDSLQSNESFAYKSDSNDYYANNATTNPNHTSLNPNNDKYYFILTPYINHNLYFKAGNYNLSGLDGGFIAAFSGKLSPSNYLGAHFGFSYGSLSDKSDKAFSIKSANLMSGLNYKFDMIWNMYLKARGDFYYFINEIRSNSVATIKPNNLGFGVSMAYGKDFNFGNGGVFGAEIGIDYKALSANTLNVKSALNNSALQDYDKALYNLIYLDLGANYHKILWRLWIKC